MNAIEELRERIQGLKYDSVAASLRGNHLVELLLEDALFNLYFELHALLDQTWIMAGAYRGRFVVDDNGNYHLTDLSEALAR